MVVETANAGYSDDKIVSSVSRVKTTALTTDSKKRKIIDSLEDVVEDVSREMSEILHDSKRLTDGEVEKKQRDNEDV